MTHNLSGANLYKREYEFEYDKFVLMFVIKFY